MPDFTPYTDPVDTYLASISTWKNNYLLDRKNCFIPFYRTTSKIYEDSMIGAESHPVIHLDNYYE
jgi:hypothetical protein